MLCGQRVDVREHAGAFLDVAHADGELLGTVDPRFGARSVLGGMVAEHRRERGDLKPAGQELGTWPARETADIGAAIRKARQAEVEELLDGKPEMIPGGAVVAGPGHGIALSAGISGAGHDEGP